MKTDNSRGDGHKSPALTRRSFAKAAGVSAAALAIGGTGAFAWFTGRDVVENKLSIAQNLNVRVIEPAWKPEDAVNVVPNQHLPKDPRIENLSDEITGWMFVEIRVPTAVVSVFDDETKTVKPAERTPLFSFTADPEWTVLEQFEDGDEDVYRFGWPKTISAKGQTPPIFEEVVFANLAEAQGQSGNKIIKATGYGIQAEALLDVTTAWDAYKKQNGIGDGKPDKRIVSAVTAGTLLKFVEGVPEVGDTIDGAVIEEVVADVEHLDAGDTTPLTSTPGQITYVDAAIQATPENTVNWFKDIWKAEEMDLAGLDPSETSSTEGMFEGCNKLYRIVGGVNLADIVPSEFEYKESEKGYTPKECSMLGFDKSARKNVTFTGWDSQNHGVFVNSRRALFAVYSRLQSKFGNLSNFIFAEGDGGSCEYQKGFTSDSTSLKNCTLTISRSGDSIVMEFYGVMANGIGACRCTLEVPADSQSEIAFKMTYEGSASNVSMLGARIICNIEKLSQEK